MTPAQMVCNPQNTSCYLNLGPLIFFFFFPFRDSAQFLWQARDAFFFRAAFMLNLGLSVGATESGGR